MNSMRFRKDIFFFYSILLVITIIYLLHAPFTVQTGDSGELSASAFNLLVPHPPGYPLWVWLNHLWLQIVNIRTTYFSLSIFSIVLSISTLIVLSKNIQAVPAKIMAILSLGSSYLYWKHSMIPEVFILNLLLTATVIYFGNLKTTIGKYKIPLAALLMPLAYSLGITNHHTIIFLLPFVIWICWQHKKSPWLYISIATGVVVCAFLYISILAMNTHHLYSWGDLRSLNDIWNHFLRRDYGTFTLHPNPNKDSFKLLLIYFLEQLVLTTSPLILLSGWTLGEKLFSKKSKEIYWNSFNTAIAASIVFYIFAFLPLMEMAPILAREEMVERFFLFPLFLVVLLLAKFISENYNFNSKLRVFFPMTLVAIISLLSFSVFSTDNDYSENTIASDYAHNFLNIASEYKNSYIYTNSDNEYYALRYTQVVEDIHPKIFVVSNFGYLMTPKVQELLPNLQFRVRTPGPGETISLAKDIIAPNEANSTLISDRDEFSPDLLNITYLPLGAVISSGSGIRTQRTKHIPQFRSDVSIIKKPYSKYDPFRFIFSKYTYFFNAQGLAEADKGNLPAAIDSFERALGLAPYDKHALANLCKLKSALKTDDSKCKFLKDSEEWFDYYQYNKDR